MNDLWGAWTPDGARNWFDNSLYNIDNEFFTIKAKKNYSTEGIVGALTIDFAAMNR